MIDVGAITALVSALGTAIGTLSGVLISNKLTTWRIEQLEKKVDKQNALFERVIKIEQKLEDMKNENHD